MVLSPRFRRGLPAAQAGTSIIAALVFAALLGAVALGLNAFQANSVNTSALPAAAGTPTTDSTTAPTNSDQVQCQAGHVYYVAKQTQGTTYDIDPSQISARPSPGNGTVPVTNFTYPNPNYNQGKQVVVGAATVDACNYSKTSSGTNECWPVVGDLLGTMDSKCISTYVISYAKQAKTALASCPAASSKGTGVEIYMKDNAVQVESCQAGSSLQLTDQSTSQSQPPSSPSSGATSVSPDSGIACTPPASGGSFSCTGTDLQAAQNAAGQNYTCSFAASPEGDDINCNSNFNVSQNCTGSASAGYSCSNTTPQAAQSALGSNYNCSYADVEGGSNTSVTCANTSNPTLNPGGNANTPGSPCKTFQQQPGTTNASGVCIANTSTALPPATPAAPAAPAARPAGSNNPLGGLTSFLSGLTRGLTPCTQSPYPQYQSPYVGGNGTTLVPVQAFNPSTGQYTTTYIQQQTSPYGNPYGSPYGASPCAPTQSAPYGVGNNGVACTVPPSQPQCAAGATAQPISASGNGCVTSYQCVPTSSTLGQTPTPSLSCSPQVADVGQSVAISYSCTNATGSSGSGFSTNNQTSGTANVTIQAPPSGTNTANFGLTCTDNGQNASAQCSVQIDQPAIDLVADPQSVSSGGTASVGWVTAGMQSCVISSPDDAKFTAANANNTSPNGVAQTDAITGDTEFDLTCTTLGGQTKKASTTIMVGATSTAAANLTVSSTADGATLNHGGSATITWSSASSTSGEAAAIWLIDLNTEEATALIAGDQPASGSYTWQVPAAGSTCDTTSYDVCASDLAAGDSYGIEVALYTPADAYLGPQASAPANAVSPTYADYGYTANPFTVGQ